MKSSQVLKIILVVIAISFSHEAIALIGMSGGRAVFPTIEGAELEKQMQIYRQYQAATARGGEPSREGAGSRPTKEDALEAIRLVSGAPPKEDKRTIAFLAEVLSTSPDSDIQSKAAEGLANIGNVDDEKEYRSFGGTLPISNLQGTVGDILRTELSSKSTDVVEASAKALAELAPTNEAVIKDLSRTFQADHEIINPQLEALRALYAISERARRTGDVDLLPQLEGAARVVESSPGLLASHPAAHAMRDEITALQNVKKIRETDKFRNGLMEVGYAVALLHAGLYLIVLIGVRWSLLCRRIMYDPVFSKVSLYFYFILKYSSHTQQWLTRAYIKELSDRRDSSIKFLPVPLYAEEGKISPAILVDYWLTSRFVWVVGRSGMGKTTLARHVELDMVCQLSGLHGSCRKRQRPFAPIFIRARDYTDLQIDLKAEPDGWIIACCQRVMARNRFPVEDKGLLRAMLRSGQLGIIVDGIGETGRVQELYDFVDRNMEVPVFVTSQAAPDFGLGTFRVFKLPASISGFTRDLLQLYMGDENGAATYEAIERSGLVGELRSGYDVSLISQVSDWYGLENLAQTRREIFRQALNSNAELCVDHRLLMNLFEVAWRMFLSGERRISGDMLDADLVAALELAKITLIRRVSSRAIEFRHDQMRAYLAAEFLLKSCLTPNSLKDVLGGGEVWKVSSLDQQEIWSMYVQGISSCSDLGQVWLFSIDKPEHVVLQHAAQVRGEALGCDWAPSEQAAQLQAGPNR